MQFSWHMQHGPDPKYLRVLSTAKHFLDCASKTQKTKYLSVLVSTSLKLTVWCAQMIRRAAHTVRCVVISTRS